MNAGAVAERPRAKTGPRPGARSGPRAHAPGPAAGTGITPGEWAAETLTYLQDHGVVLVAEKARAIRAGLRRRAEKLLQAPRAPT